MLEFRFHGRGGQGAVTASELLAEAVGAEGKSSQAFPVFGVERRGAPVTAFCRVDSKPIRVHQEVYYPNVVVVLDGSLVDVVDVTAGLAKDGILIVNSRKDKKEYAKLVSGTKRRLFVVDASSIALKNVGAPIVNTAMLGALVKATKICKLESVLDAVNERFSGGPLAERNTQAVKECFEQLK